MTRKNGEFLIRRGSSALVKHTDPREVAITPAADIGETRDAFIVKVDMPGAKRESIKVNWDSGILLIQGDTEPLHAPTASVPRNERSKTAYYRKFKMTPGLESGRITAEFEDGVLTISIPKSPSPAAKEIRIQ